MISRMVFVRWFVVLVVIVAAVSGTIRPGQVLAQEGDGAPSPAAESSAPVLEPSTDPAIPSGEDAPVESPSGTSPSGEPSIDTPSVGPSPEAPIVPVPSVAPVVDPSVVPGAVDGDAGDDSGTDPDTGDPTVRYDVAGEAIELRARQQDVVPADAAIGQGVGTTVFVSQDLGFFPFAAGESAPLAGATFQVVATDTNDLIDEVITGETGLIFLDIPLDTPFTIIDVANGSGGVSEPFTVTAEDVESGREVITATRFVPAGTVGAAPGGADTGLFDLAQDAIELRSVSRESSTDDNGRTSFSTGGFFFFPFPPNFPLGDDVSAEQLDDFAPLPGATFVVVTETGRIVDRATTDADGIVLLDLPLGVDFVVRDVTTGGESDSFFFEPEDVQDGRLLLTATRTIDVLTGNNRGPDGDLLEFPVARDYLEVRARFLQDPGLDGQTQVTYSNLLDGGLTDAAFSNGESIPAPGVTITILTDDGRVIDRQVTDADGIALLDMPISSLDQASNFLIQEGQNGVATPLFPLPADGFFIPLPFPFPFPIGFPGAGDGRLIATVTMAVGDLDEVASPAPASASASAIASTSAGASAPASPTTSGGASASASASAAPSFSGEVVPDGVTVTGLVKVDDARAGEYDYFAQVDEVTTLADEPVSDTRTAFAGEQTYEVYAIVDGDSILVDRGDTDANGMVVLDIPVAFDYFITEVNDPIGGPTVEAGLETAFVVIEYVATAAASTAPSAVASAAGSLAPVASASASGTGGTTALPNTGAGSSDMGSSMTWALFALLAVAGVAAAGVGLRRRGA